MGWGDTEVDGSSKPGHGCDFFLLGCIAVMVGLVRLTLRLVRRG